MDGHQGDGPQHWSEAWSDVAPQEGGEFELPHLSSPMSQPWISPDTNFQQFDTSFDLLAASPTLLDNAFLLNMTIPSSAEDQLASFPVIEMVPSVTSTTIPVVDQVSALSSRRNSSGQSNFNVPTGIYQIHLPRHATSFESEADGAFPVINQLLQASSASFSSNGVDVNPLLRNQQFRLDSANSPYFSSMDLLGSSNYPVHGYTSTNTSMFGPNIYLPPRSQFNPFLTPPSMSQMNLSPNCISSNHSQFLSSVGSTALLSMRSQQMGSSSLANSLFVASDGTSYLPIMNNATSSQITRGRLNTFTPWSSQVGDLTPASQSNSNHHMRNQRAFGLTSMPVSHNPSYVSLFVRNQPFMSNIPGIRSNELRIRSYAFTPPRNHVSNPIPAPQLNNSGLLMNQLAIGSTRLQVGQSSSHSSPLVAWNSTLSGRRQSDSLPIMYITPGIRSNALTTVRNQVTSPRSVPQSNSGDSRRNQQASGLTPLLGNQSSSHAYPLSSWNSTLSRRTQSNSLPLSNNIPGVCSNSLPTVRNQVTNPIPSPQSSSSYLIRNQEGIGLIPLQVGQTLSRRSQSDSLPLMNNASGVSSNALTTLRNQVSDPIPTPQSNSSGPIKNQQTIGLTPPLQVCQSSSHASSPTAQNSSLSRSQSDSPLLNTAPGVRSNGSTMQRSSNLLQRPSNMTRAASYASTPMRSSVVNPSPVPQSDSNGFVRNQEALGQASFQVGQTSLQGGQNSSHVSGNSGLVRIQESLGQTTSEVGQTSLRGGQDSSHISYATCDEKFRCHLCTKEFSTYGGFGGHILAHSRKRKMAAEVTSQPNSSDIKSPLAPLEHADGSGPEPTVPTSSSLLVDNKTEEKSCFSEVKVGRSSSSGENNIEKFSDVSMKEECHQSRKRLKQESSMESLQATPDHTHGSGAVSNGPTVSSSLLGDNETEGSNTPDEAEPGTECNRPYKKRFKGESSTQNDIAGNDSSAPCKVPKKESAANGGTEENNCPPMHDTAEDHPSEMDVTFEQNDSLDEQDSDKSF